MIKQAIESLVGGSSLTTEQASGVMAEIMDGKATPAQVAAFATALHIKGETADEITGMTKVMQANAVPVKASPPLVDTCGTGGDKSHSFNISTAAAIIAAGAGLRVAKHGNRAMSSRCGSADVLEALGVNIELGPEAVARCLDEIGIAFMFAPLFHPTMKHAAAPRREIGIRTVFNLLGPLVNPARVQHQVMGVATQGMGETIAKVLHQLGTKHALVVHGMDGMDEISISDKSLVWDVTPKGVAPPYKVTAHTFGFNQAAAEEIKGDTPEDNARILRSILKGEPGPRRDIAVMNAAAAMVAADRATDLNQGAAIAQEAIDSGKARRKLDALVELSQSYA